MVVLVVVAVDVVEHCDCAVKLLGQCPLRVMRQMTGEPCDRDDDHHHDPSDEHRMMVDSCFVVLLFFVSPRSNKKRVMPLLGL